MPPICPKCKHFIGNAHRRGGCFPIDVWGHSIVTVADGHSAWSCNDRNCKRHPAELYGKVEK